MQKFCLLLLFIIAFSTQTGCIERKFVLITSPANVDIYVDGVYIGESKPKDSETGIYEFNFNHYGTREIVLTKNDYETRREYIDPSLPWFEVFPIDFFADVLLPFTIRSEFIYRFDLKKYEDVNTEELYEEGNKIRKEAKINLSEPFEN